MITIDDLSTAIESGIIREDQSLSYEEAFDLAQHILNFFGYSNRIIDNVLEPEDRSAFYMLEDAGILNTEREEITLYDGREWRIHYWLINRDRIDDMVKNGVQAKPVKKEVDRTKVLFENLPDGAWVRPKE